MDEASTDPHEEEIEVVDKDQDKKRGWQEKPRAIGEEKMAQMGIECVTCGRPYDEAFFSKRIIQLSQRRGELECPTQPKVRVRHAPTNIGTAYSWEIIANLEEKIKKLKQELEVKELGLETKTNDSSEGDNGKEEEGRIKGEEEDVKE